MFISKEDSFIECDNWLSEMKSIRQMFGFLFVLFCAIDEMKLNVMLLIVAAMEWYIKYV